MRTENTRLQICCFSVTYIVLVYSEMGKSGEGHLVTQGHGLYPQTTFRITAVLLSTLIDTLKESSHLPGCSSHNSKEALDREAKAHSTTDVFTAD